MIRSNWLSTSLLRPLLGAFLVIGMGFGFPAQGALLIEHVGSTDPTSEGWTDEGAWGKASVGVGAIDDGGTAAWFVDDSTTSGGSARYYNYVPSVADEATMVNDGWRLSATLRVVDVPDAVDYGVFLGVSLGNNRWILQFGSDADGNTLMKAALDPVPTGPEFTLSAGFHDYLLEYDPSTYQLALSVDGNVLMQNFYGFPETRAPVVQWGAGATAHT